MENRVLFLTFMPLSPSDGISRKILAEAEALRKSGNDLELGYIRQEEGTIAYIIGEKEIASYPDSFAGKLAIYTSALSRIAGYAAGKGFRALYLRYFLFATPALIGFLRRMRKEGMKVFVEIPTFPYDGERLQGGIAARMRKVSDRLFRKKMAGYVDRFVTFSLDSEIWGVPAISISNGIDLERIPLSTRPDDKGDFNVIGVAVLAPWHGYDRMIDAMARYAAENPEGRRVVFHVVGKDPDGVFLELLKTMARQKGVEENVVFHGLMSGKELDDLFSRSHLAIGSLGRHRNGIKAMRSLKNVEYASRGIPFVYSEDNPDFDGKEFVMKVAPDESPLDITAMIRFYQGLSVTPEEIRLHALPYSWDRQMKTVSDAMRQNI